MKEGPSDEVRKFMAENGRQGGLARAKKLSPEQRRESAKNAVSKRKWRTPKKKDE